MTRVAQNVAPAQQPPITTPDAPAGGEKVNGLRDAIKDALSSESSDEPAEPSAEQQLADATAEAKTLLKRFGLKRAAIDSKGSIHFEKGHIQYLEESGEELTIITA